MQRPLKGKRPRISVSLDPDVHDWIQKMGGPSESYTVCRILRAAMLAGIKVEDARSEGVLEDLCAWLGKKKKSKQAMELHALLEEYIKQ